MGGVAERVEFTCAVIFLTPPALVLHCQSAHETQVWVKNEAYTGCTSMKPVLQDHDKTRGHRSSRWLTCSFTQPTGKLLWA